MFFFSSLGVENVKLGKGQKEALVDLSSVKTVAMEQSNQNVTSVFIPLLILIDSSVALVIFH